jgi:uncharacterized protein (TIGR02466 family)
LDKQGYIMTSTRQWLKHSDVLSIFPTLVWQFTLDTDTRDSLSAKILPVLETERPPPVASEHGKGWQSRRDLHRLEAFHELVTCINDAVRSILGFLKIGCDDFEITGCWANVNPPGAAHGIHSHPNNFLSGVYYLQTQPGADTINFHDPRIQTGIIRPPVTELTAANTDQIVVSVSNGTLLLFPAYLQHSVSPNESGEDRISISFNVMFSAFTENIAGPLW